MEIALIKTKPRLKKILKEINLIKQKRNSNLDGNSMIINKDKNSMSSLKTVQLTILLSQILDMENQQKVNIHWLEVAGNHLELLVKETALWE